MKIIIKVIFILAFSIAIIAASYQTYNLISKENVNKTNVSITNAIDNSLKLMSTEIQFDDIITDKRTWIFNMNPSIAYVTVKGTVTAGSELIDLKKNGNSYTVTLSEPQILPQDIKQDKVGEWQTHEGPFNKFPANEQGAVFEANSKILADKMQKELQDTIKENNRDAITAIINSFAKGVEVKIIYTNNTAQKTT